MSALIVVAVIVAAIVAVSVVLSRRAARDGGEDRAQRRREIIASDPTLTAMYESTGGQRFSFRRSNVAEVVADVARDAVDRPNGASSDDLDRLARPPHGEP